MPPNRAAVIDADELKRIPELRRWLRLKAQNPKYLHGGDVAEASVATDGGVIDLGTQRTVVRHE